MFTDTRTLDSISDLRDDGTREVTYAHETDGHATSPVLITVGNGRTYTVRSNQGRAAARTLRSTVNVPGYGSRGRVIDRAVIVSRMTKKAQRAMLKASMAKAIDIYAR